MANFPLNTVQDLKDSIKLKGNIFIHVCKTILGEELSMLLYIG